MVPDVVYATPRGEVRGTLQRLMLWILHPIHRHPYNSNPRPASADALLRLELAATSVGGALHPDSSGSDTTAE